MKHKSPSMRQIPNVEIIVDRLRLIDRLWPMEVEAVLRGVILDQVLVQLEFLVEKHGADLDQRLADFHLAIFCPGSLRIDQANPNPGNLEHEMARLAEAGKPGSHNEDIVDGPIWFFHDTDPRSFRINTPLLQRHAR